MKRTFETSALQGFEIKGESNYLLGICGGGVISQLLYHPLMSIL